MLSALLLQLRFVLHCLAVETDFEVGNALAHALHVCTARIAGNDLPRTLLADDEGYDANRRENGAGPYACAYRSARRSLDDRMRSRRHGGHVGFSVSLHCGFVMVWSGDRQGYWQKRADPLARPRNNATAPVDGTRRKDQARCGVARSRLVIEGDRIATGRK